MKLYEAPQADVVSVAQTEEVAFGDMQLPLSALVPKM